MNIKKVSNLLAVVALLAPSSSSAAYPEGIPTESHTNQTYWQKTVNYIE